MTKFFSKIKPFLPLAITVLIIFSFLPSCNGQKIVLNTLSGKYNLIKVNSRVSKIIYFEFESDNTFKQYFDDNIYFGFYEIDENGECMTLYTTRGKQYYNYKDLAISLDGSMITTESGESYIKLYKK